METAQCQRVAVASLSWTASEIESRTSEMISCLRENEESVHRLGGQQHTSKWKRTNPQVRMREQEPVQLAERSRNRQILTYPIQCFLPLPRIFVFWKGAEHSLQKGQTRLSKSLSPQPGLSGCSLCPRCPYLGHSCLQHNVLHGQRCRVQHGDHHDQHVRASRRALPGKVQQDPEPVLVVGCHGQGTACHRERRERIQAGAAHPFSLFHELCQEALPLKNIHSKVKNLKYLLGLMDSKGTWTLAKEISGAFTGLPCCWNDAGWKRGLPDPAVQLLVKGAGGAPEAGADRPAGAAKGAGVTVVGKVTPANTEGVAMPWAALLQERQKSHGEYSWK